MRPIPAKIRKQLSEDPAMKQCLICGSPLVEFDHVFTGLGCKQINEWWAIAPLCYDHHRGKLRDKTIQRYAQWWCLQRAGQEPEIKYPKTNWGQQRQWLSYKFEHFKNFKTYVGNSPSQNMP